MADVSITASSVLMIAGGGAKQKTVVAGEAGITAGMMVFQQTSDSRYYKARANSAATADVDGVALNGASTGQPLEIMETVRGGSITIGGTLAPGIPYAISNATAGRIRPINDVASGEHCVIVGIATSASVLKIGILDADTPATQEIT